jgi:hypothetical protein
MTLHDAIIMSRFLLFVGLAMNVIRHVYGLVKAKNKEVLEHIEHNPNTVVILPVTGIYLWLLYSDVFRYPDHPLPFIFYMLLASYLAILALPRYDRRQSDLKKKPRPIPVINERVNYGLRSGHLPVPPDASKELREIKFHLEQIEDNQMIIMQKLDAKGGDGME